MTDEYFNANPSNLGLEAINIWYLYFHTYVMLQFYIGKGNGFFEPLTLSGWTVRRGDYWLEDYEIGMLRFLVS